MITVNLTKMFASREPWDCSNSIANLGSRAAELTWACAMEVAARSAEWVVEGDAVDEIKSWACDAGAWGSEEIEAWTEQEALALLVQNIASDLRTLGSDDLDLEWVVTRSIDELEGPDHPVTAPYRDANTGEVLAYWSAE